MKKQILAKMGSLVLAITLILNMNLVGAFALEDTIERNSQPKEMTQAKGNKTSYQLELKKVMDKTADYVYKTVAEPGIGSIGGEWAIYGLKRADYPMSAAYLDAYKKTVIDKLNEGFRGKKGILHDRKYTDYSRVILTFSHLGWDVRDVGGYDLLIKLADFNGVKWQGINGPMWALIALDAGSHKIPKKESDAKIQTTRQLLVDEILKYQMADGGWRYGVELDELDKFESESDMTAMSIRALAPYGNQKKVKKAINRALKNLSKIQEDDGTYSFWDSKTSESCSQVICALSILGIDAKTDKRFIKKGKTVIDGLMSFYDKETGGFRHVNEASGGFQPVVNQMATEQGLYALGEYWQADFTKSSQSKSVETKTDKLPKIKGLSLIIKNKKAELRWKKIEGVSGYQVVYSPNKNFKKAKKSIVSEEKISLNKLNKKTTYYFKVRAFRTTDNGKNYGAFSKVISVKLG